MTNSLPSAQVLSEVPIFLLYSCIVPYTELSLYGDGHFCGRTELSHQICPDDG